MCDKDMIFNIPMGIDKSKRTWTSKDGNLYQKDYCSQCDVDIIVCPYCDMGSCSGTSCEYCNDDFTEWLSK